ncbi:MAG: DinB family protein [Gemmatimonadetes bacterium]|nr:DinB family protein [Gemmatimonadota bacterium]
MTHDPRSSDAVFALLDHERANLFAQFERVPPARRAERPGEGAWSAAEIAEHVARVEMGVAKSIVKGGEMPRTATAEELDAAQMTPRKIAAVRDRSTKVEAPERVRPTGTPSADAVPEQLRATRVAMLGAFRGADAAVLDGITFPHPFLGPLTLRAWVVLVAHHDARHAAQMADVADHWLATH